MPILCLKSRLGRPQANLCSDAARPLQRSNLKPPWNADPWNAPNFWPAAGGNFLGFVSVSLTKSTAETVFQYIEIVVSTMIAWPAVPSLSKYVQKRVTQCSQSGRRSAFASGGDGCGLCQCSVCNHQLPTVLLTVSDSEHCPESRYRGDL